MLGQRAVTSQCVTQSLVVAHGRHGRVHRGRRATGCGVFAQEGRQRSPVQTGGQVKTQRRRIDPAHTDVAQVPKHRQRECDLKAGRVNRVGVDAVVVRVKAVRVGSRQQVHGLAARAGECARVINPHGFDCTRPVKAVNETAFVHRGIAGQRLGGQQGGQRAVQVA